ncbi:MAG: multidrug efflux SMR transporter [Hyphomicrobium sp.]
MAWVYLLIAGAFEVATTTMYRYTGGLTRITPTVAFFTLGLVSFYFLNRALASIPIGTAYAAWTGIGAAGTVLIGVVFYNEPATIARLVLLTLLIGSIVGLKLVSPD